MDLDKFTPRLLGMMFIVVIVLGFIGGLPILSLNYSYVGPPDNISETMISFSDNSTMVQMSIVGFLIEAAAIVLLAVLLYIILKEQNKIIALWALGLWILEAVFLAVREISTFCLLHTSQEYVTAGASDSSYLLNLGSLFYGLTNFSYTVQMVFYCIGGILFYYLFLKSKYVPRVLSFFGIIVASVGFVGELYVLFGYNVPLYVFLPILPFEIAIGIWLMVKGIKTNEIKSKSG
jgi:hypothetical protein